MFGRVSVYCNYSYVVLCVQSRCCAPNPNLSHTLPTHTSRPPILPLRSTWALGPPFSQGLRACTGVQGFASVKHINLQRRLRSCLPDMYYHKLWHTHEYLRETAAMACMFPPHIFFTYSSHIQGMTGKYGLKVRQSACNTFAPVSQMCCPIC